MTKLAFLGLGVMGYPIAGHLARAGYDVCVYNRTVEKAVRWQREFGGEMALTPEEAAEGAEFVFACVGNDDDLRAVVLDEFGALHGMKAGSIFIDHTTVSARVSVELHKIVSEKGCGYIDAPVSGGQAGAENGTLAIMCGGMGDDFARVQPVLDVYSKICRRLGNVGSGQLAKMVNQICLTGLIQGLAEGLHFAEKAGLKIEDVIEVIENGAAGSWQMSNRHQTMTDDVYDFGFAVDWMRKDLSICLEAAHENGASLPVTALVDGFYKDVQAQGGGRWDTSSLIRRLRGLDGSLKKSGFRD